MLQDKEGQRERCARKREDTDRKRGDRMREDRGRGVSGEEKTEREV